MEKYFDLRVLKRKYLHADGEVHCESDRVQESNLGPPPRARSCDPVSQVLVNLRGQADGLERLTERFSAPSSPLASRGTDFTKFVSEQCSLNNGFIRDFNELRSEYSLHRSVSHAELRRSRLPWNRKK